MKPAFRPVRGVSLHDVWLYDEDGEEEKAASKPPESFPKSPIMSSKSKIRGSFLFT